MKDAKTLTGTNIECKLCQGNLYPTTHGLKCLLCGNIISYEEAMKSVGGTNDSLG